MVKFEILSYQKSLDEFKDAFYRHIPKMVDVAEAAKADIENSFDKSIDPSGKPWVPLSQSSLRRKIFGGSATPEKPLIDTGAMLRSLRTTVIFNSVVIDMDAPSGEHQVGDDRLPIRRIIPQTNFEKELFTGRILKQVFRR